MAFKILLLPLVEEGRNQMATCRVKCDEMTVNRRCSFNKVVYEEISQLLVEEAMVKAGLCHILFFTIRG